MARSDGNPADSNDDENRFDFSLLRKRIKTGQLGSTAVNSEGVSVSSHEHEIWPLLLKATIVKHYIFGDVIGRGSYAEVRECIDTRDLERCAVKIVDRNFLRRQNARALANQMLELRLLQRIRHDNIISLREIFYDDSKIYIFLEFCTFVLHELLASSPNNRMCMPLCRNVFRQLLTGIQYLHSIGIIHRDVKPQNILINNEGIVKLIDFGVSHLTSIWNQSNECSNYEGSPLFQAPEIIVSENSYLGSGVDVWSAGVTLFLMLYGKYPFYDDTLLGLYDRILGDQFIIPHDLAIPGQQTILTDFIARMLDKNSATRSSTAELFKHPWMLYQQDKLDCGHSHSEFIQFSANRLDEATNDSGVESTRDIYRSTTCLPYLYNFHFPEYQVTKASTPSITHSRSSSELSTTSPSSPDPHEVIEDSPIEWGTERQFKLLKIPHVRVNRLRFGQKLAALRRRRRARCKEREVSTRSSSSSSSSNTHRR